MFYDDQFKKIDAKFPNFTYNVALSEPMKEDNWTGSTGFIHQVLHDEYLSKHEDPTEIEYYMCGPPPMINACDNMLDNLEDINKLEIDVIRYATVVINEEGEKTSKTYKHPKLETSIDFLMRKGFENDLIFKTVNEILS